MSLAHPSMSMILGLLISIGMGVAVFLIQRVAIAQYGADTLSGKRLSWVAPLLTVLLAAVLIRLENDWAVAMTKAMFGACQ